MTRVDWIALGIVALLALLGLARGAIASALSVAGVVVGAYAGARLAPHLLGQLSPYVPVAALAGAAILAIVLQSVGAMIGRAAHGALLLPPLKALDSIGGLVLGAAAGLAIVWVLGAVALELPGQSQFRRGAQRSLVLQRLDGIVPPARVLNALARVDPFPSIVGPGSSVRPPDPLLPSLPGVREAAPSVVRVLGTACGLGISGSGWVVEPGLVVTAAHVVAGQHDTVVEPPGLLARLPATAVAFDPHDDIAILRVDGLAARPLPLASPRHGEPVAILGYPENGPFVGVPGRIGETATVLSDDAYGHGPVSRPITSLRGVVRHGDSGGPAVDARGAVESTVFAARIGSKSGFGIPGAVVERDLAAARGPVSTGPCA